MAHCLPAMLPSRKQPASAAARKPRTNFRELNSKAYQSGYVGRRVETYGKRWSIDWAR
jgi:hypothetical protein